MNNEICVKKVMSVMSRVSARLCCFRCRNRRERGRRVKGEFVSRAEKPATSGLKRRCQIASD